jgi:hypothetical protein
MRFIIIIMQFRVTMGTKSRALTSSMDISYVVGHEQASSLLFQRMMSVL